MSVSSSAVVLEITCSPVGPADLLTAMRDKEVGRGGDAVVCNNAKRAHDLHHGHGKGLAKRHGAKRCSRVVLVAGHDARRLARVVDARGEADTKLVHALGKALRANDLLGEKRDANVRGAQ